MPLLERPVEAVVSLRFSSERGFRHAFRILLSRRIGMANPFLLRLQQLLIHLILLLELVGLLLNSAAYLAYQHALFKQFVLGELLSRKH